MANQQNPATEMGASVSPIADLTYRNYDGPLLNRAARWWVVSLAVLRPMMKNKGYWAMGGLCLLIYIGALMQLYFTGGIQDAVNPGQIDKSHKYASVFLSYFGFTTLFLYVVALIVGAGSIAADNKANAMMIYLSKPLTKGDYLLGKWMGVFLGIFLIAAAPPLALWVYCAGSYAGQGFFSNEPLLIFRVLLLAAFVSAIHASLIVGISAWCKAQRIASVIYSGIYFILGTIIVQVSRDGWRPAPPDRLVQYLSIQGCIDGLSKLIYDLPTSGFASSFQRGEAPKMPSALPILLIAAVYIVIGIAAARAKIKAVEVVKG
ncbi:MAG: ABC transporter permease subunit [Chthonomonadaceae bacterium]|nr:ABC transporter permease subunit [Chthonomonadaceae bacterium]